MLWVTWRLSFFWLSLGLNLDSSFTFVWAITLHIFKTSNQWVLILQIYSLNNPIILTLDRIWAILKMFFKYIRLLVGLTFTVLEDTWCCCSCCCCCWQSGCCDMSHEVSLVRSHSPWDEIPLSEQDDPNWNKYFQVKLTFTWVWFGIQGIITWLLLFLTQRLSFFVLSCICQWITI